MEFDLEKEGKRYGVVLWVARIRGVAVGVDVYKHLGSRTLKSTQRGGSLGGWRATYDALQRAGFAAMEDHWVCGVAFAAEER